MKYLYASIVLIGLLFSHAFGSSQYIHPVQFIDSRQFDAGYGAQSIAAGDFNRDGNMDVAVANFCGNDPTCAGRSSVSILLGKGDGSFGPPIAYLPLESGSRSIAAADLNGDGLLDLIVANECGIAFVCPGPQYGGSVSVFIGNGDGTFQTAVSYGTGLAAWAVAVGDFNGDGKPDLAVADASDNAVSILLGNGDGTFRSDTNFATGNFPVAMVAADFNGDGIPDLAVANSCGSGDCFAEGSVSILLGNGDGTFEAPIDMVTPANPTSIVAGDWNGDGKVDLAVAICGDCNLPPGNIDSAEVFLGKGDGTFNPPSDYPLGGRTTAMIAGALHGAQKTDLIVENGDAVTILAGDGRGNFSNHGNFGTGSYPEGVAVADFNNDGRLDIVTSNYTSAEPSAIGTVSVLLGTSGGIMFRTRREYTVGNSPVGVALGDLNGDGKIDIAAINGCGNSSPSKCENPTFPIGTVSVLTGNGDGSFSHKADYRTARFPSAIITADFNGDGKLDLAVTNFCGNSPYCGYPGGPPPVGKGLVSILLANSDGTFQSAVNLETGWHPTSVAAADFNGDGNVDLVVVNQCGEDTTCSLPGDGNISILLGNGDGSFRQRKDFATGNGPQTVAVGDFNGDGFVDLAVTSYKDNTVSILLGKGDGTFKPHVDFPVGNSPYGVAVADFNSDGKLDLAVTNFYPNSTVSILLGRGDGTFQSSLNYPTGNEPAGIAVGDFNHDGKIDLVIASEMSGAASLLLGNGDGTFGTFTNYAAGRGGALAVADVNHDGKLDIVFAAWSDDAVSILLNSGK